MKKQKEILKDRTRELIYHPNFECVPIYKLCESLNIQLKNFREKHKQFDDFLKEFDLLLKQENNPDFKNIRLLIEGIAEGNWLNKSNKCLLSGIIRLYNYCLSPKQVLDYLKECNRVYQEMLESDFCLSDYKEISIRKGYNNKQQLFITFTMYPQNKIEGLEDVGFKITTSLRFYEDNFNHLLIHITDFTAIDKYNDKMEEILMLCDYYQRDKKLVRKVFDEGIRQLEEKGIIKETERINHCGWILHTYTTNLTIDF